MSAPYYWVIDGFDECVEYAKLFSLLKSTVSRFPFHLFITSRKLLDMARVLRYLHGSSAAIVDIPAADTMRDIVLVIRSRMRRFSFDGQGVTDDLARCISARAGTSFLWTRLVVDELETVNDYETMMVVINQIPRGMIPYYSRTISKMAENRRERHLAHAILLRVVTAARPLTVQELALAVQAETKVRLGSPKAAIDGLCGDLVFVDSRTDTVRIVHDSARQYLLEGDTGAFQFPRSR